MVSYADFVTLLFSLFVVLFASTYHDKKTIQRVSTAVKNGFQEMGAFVGSDSIRDSTSSDISKLGGVLNPNDNGGARVGTIPGNAGIDVVELQRKLTKALGKEIERQEVELRMTPEGFVISLHELGFFDSGQAVLLPGAAEKIERIARILDQRGLDLWVEGHSDNQPIHNAQFASNWELSTARAMTVLLLLVDQAGYDPSKVSISGYAQYRPLADDSTPEGRRQNRRVDLVVVGNALAPKRTP